MSEKEMVLDAIRRLPAAATIDDIRERVEFLAALKEGEENLDRGKGVSQTLVAKQFKTWLKQTRRRVPKNGGRIERIEAAAGVWKSHKDLPNFQKLRQEWERS